MQLSIPPRSSGSAALTPPTGLRNSSISITEIVVVGVAGVALACVLVACCLWQKQRRSSGRYHPNPSNPREDDLYGRTSKYLPYFPYIKTTTLWGNNDVKINSLPFHPVHLGNTFEPQPSPPVSMPHPPTSQPVLNSGVDSSSGFPASQQPLPSPPPVLMPCPPPSRRIFNSGDDSRSGFPASQQPFPPPPPVFMPCPRPVQPVVSSGDDLSSVFPGLQQPLPPPTSVFMQSLPPPQPVFSSRDDLSSVFPGSQQHLPPPPPGISLGISKKFTYEELEVATDGFSETNLLGQGGFGYVYKGILPGNKNIAVKKLKVRGSEGECGFQAEVEIISCVHHRNLVSLLGYCVAGSQRLLVYEFVPNNTLEHHLHAEGQPSMKWPTRLKIAIGAARGLAYLHEDCYPKIIHRDIKASNILLDSNFETKIADFGLAKLASEGSPRVNTTPKGTFGYLDPEYVSSGELTDKSDVFSFGVVLLELITGRQPLDLTLSFPESSLVYSARPLLARAMEDGNLDALVDPRLQNNYNVNDMMRVVGCAASCIQKSARSRSRMERIVRVLEGDVPPGILHNVVSPLYVSVGISVCVASQYNEDTEESQKIDLGSHEHGSVSTVPLPVNGVNQSVSSR